MIPFQELSAQCFGEVEEVVQAGKEAAVANADALRKAWVPFGAGWKALWWESMVTPSDVEDEAAFRAGPVAQCL